MYRLQLAGNKSFTYNSQNDTLYFQKHSTTTLSDDQWCSHLLNLASKRPKATKPERPLYTAFMMKLAQGFAGYDAAVAALQGVHSRREGRMEVLQCFVDVLQKKIKPMFPVAFEEREEDEEEEPERASTPESVATIVVSSQKECENGPSRGRPSRTSPIIQTPPSSAAKTHQLRGRKRVVRSASPDAVNDDDIGIPSNGPGLIDVDISSLRTQVKKLKREREELETRFKELHKRRRENLLAKAEELQRVNKELRAKIEDLELTSDCEDETE